MPLPLVTIVSLEQGVDAFQTEYGQLPDVGSRVQTDSPEGLKLIAILLGLEDPSGVVQNKRGIRFLAVRDGKNGKNGLIFSPEKHTVEGLYDQWGSPYTVLLDAKTRESSILKSVAGSWTLMAAGLPQLHRDRTNNWEPGMT